MARLPQKVYRPPSDGKVSPFCRSLNWIGAVPRQWRRCRTGASSATTRAALIPNENGHFSHSTHTNFHYFLRYFSRLHRTNFSQFPQELFTELIGLALLFSLLRPGGYRVSIETISPLQECRWQG